MINTHDTATSRAERNLALAYHLLVDSADRRDLTAVWLALAFVRMAKTEVASVAAARPEAGAT